MTNQPLSEKIKDLCKEYLEMFPDRQEFIEVILYEVEELQKQAIQKTLKELKEEINKLSEGETEIGNDCLIVRKLELTDFIDTTFKQNFGELTNQSQQTKPCKSSEVKIIGETRKTAQTLGDKTADTQNQETKSGRDKLLPINVTSSDVPDTQSQEKWKQAVQKLKDKYWKLMTKEQFFNLVNEVFGGLAE